MCVFIARHFSHTKQARRSLLLYNQQENLIVTLQKREHCCMEHGCQLFHAESGRAQRWSGVCDVCMCVRVREHCVYKRVRVVVLVPT